jgi:hypothetical protein
MDELMRLLPYAVFLRLIAGILLPVLIVGIIFWFKAHEKDLQFHQDMRIREMEHQKKMMEMQIDLEKAKAREGVE